MPKQMVTILFAIIASYIMAMFPKRIGYKESRKRLFFIMENIACIINTP